MIDIQILKRKNPIQDVLTEWGLDLAWDDKRKIYENRAEVGFIVDPKAQRFNRADGASGDVISWLQVNSSWSFHQALQYLENRANLPDNEKAKAAKVMVDLNEALDNLALPGVAPQEPDEFIEAAKRNPFVRKALRLGSDYPGGMEEILKSRNWIRFYTESGWMPGELMPVIGLLTDSSCSFCGKDLSKWQRPGQAYLALNVDDEDGFIRHEAQVFCTDCLGKFRRWYEALMLLAQYVRNCESEDNGDE